MCAPNVGRSLLWPQRSPANDKVINRAQGLRKSFGPNGSRLSRKCLGQVSKCLESRIKSFDIRGGDYETRPRVQPESLTGPEL